MKISELKEKRDALLARIKELEEKITQKKKELETLDGIEREERAKREQLNRLDFKISTEPLSAAREKEMAKIMEKLEKELRALEKKKKDRDTLEEEIFKLEEEVDAIEVVLYEIRKKLNADFEERMRAAEERRERERKNAERRAKALEEQMSRQRTKEKKKEQREEHPSAPDTPEIFLGDIAIIKKKNAQGSIEDFPFEPRVKVDETE